MNIKANSKLPVISLLMLVTGLLIYYLYLKPEAFETAVTCPQNCIQPSTPQIPTSIVSRYFGIGFNIYPANNGNQSANSTLILIEHIPVVYNNTLGSMYSISSDGQLTIKLRNDLDPSQWWNLTQASDSTSSYYIITPFTQNVSTTMALQYENGNLALRPYTAPGFESQKWITTTNKITRGIPVLNYNPASLFTPEFDPYSTSTNINSTTTQQNNQQVNDVLAAVKANIQQYLTQIGSTNQSIPNVTSSSLGNKEMPLNINLNLGSGTSAFANVTPTDVLGLLDKYENKSNTPQFMSATDLSSVIDSGKCAPVNMNDYTSNRVSSCNCKI